MSAAPEPASPPSVPELRQTAFSLAGGIVGYVGWNPTIAGVICETTGDTAWSEASTIGFHDDAGRVLAVMLHSPCRDGSVAVSAVRMGLPISREILKGVVDYARWRWGATALTTFLRVDDLAAMKTYRRLRFLPACHVMQPDGERVVMRLTFDRLPAIWFRPPANRLH